MSADFYSERLVHGRRAYECTHCRRPIEKGAQHLALTFCACGRYSSHRAHVACHEAATGHSILQRAEEAGQSHKLSQPGSIPGAAPTCHVSTKVEQRPASEVSAGAEVESTVVVCANETPAPSGSAHSLVEVPA